MHCLKGVMNDGLACGPASTSTNCWPISYLVCDWAGPNSGKKSFEGYILLYEGSPYIPAVEMPNVLSQHVRDTP